MQRPIPPGAARSARLSYARTMRHAPEPASASAARAVGVLLALLLAALVVLHGFTLATGRTAAERTLRGVLPALIDLDQALASHPNEISAAADVGSDPVALPGLPLTVEVPRAAALAGGERLRAATVEQAARGAYRDGPSVFHAEDAKGGAVGLFTTQWSVRRSFSFLTAGTHQRLVTARMVVLVLTVGATLLFLLIVDRSRWLVASGSVCIAGAALAVAALLGARALVWVLMSGSGGAASAVTARIARDVLFTSGAVALVVGVAGVVLVLLGVLFARSGDGQRSGMREESRRRAARPVADWEDA